MNTFGIKDPTGKDLGIIETWFPKPIMCAKNILDTENFSYILNFTNNLMTKETMRFTDLNVDSTHRTCNFKDYTEFDILKKQILERALGFGEALGYGSFSQMKNLQIIDLWANKSAGNDFIFPHVHNNSDFSGVFYLESPKDSKITFYDRIDNMSLAPENNSDLNSNITKYPCVPNSMLLFKSNMIHANEKQPKGNKLVLSFNLKML